MNELTNILHNPLFSLLLAIFVIGFIIYRQIRPRKLSKSGLLVLPLILLFFIFRSLPGFHPTQTKLLEIVLTSVVSVVVGLLACRQLHIYEGPNGKAMAKGTWKYFLWWLGAFIIKSFLAVMLGEASAKNVSTIDILIPVFLLLATRNAYLYWKVSKLKLTLH